MRNAIKKSGIESERMSEQAEMIPSKVLKKLCALSALECQYEYEVSRIFRIIINSRFFITNQKDHKSMNKIILFICGYRMRHHV